VITEARSVLRHATRQNSYQDELCIKRHFKRMESDILYDYNFLVNITSLVFYLLSCSFRKEKFLYL
jgi:hypothetical protein